MTSTVTTLCQHKATFTVSHPEFVESIICPCEKCGRLVEFTAEGKPKK